jgi:hypothetical protein
VRTFECNYCHAINTVPESLVEAAEHAHRGYIRWGGRVTLVPFGETTDAFEVHEPDAPPPVGWEPKDAGER